MSRWRGWIARAAALFGRGRRVEDFDAEIDSHLQLHVDDNLRAGMTPLEARRAAMIALGSIQASREAYRERASVPLVTLAGDTLAHAMQMCLRHRRFSATVVLLFAVGVGVTAALVNVVDALLFRDPAHVGEPDRLVVVAAAESYPQWQALRRESRALTATAWARATVTLGQGEGARPLAVHCATASYFAVLGTPLAAGTGFRADHDVPGAPPAVVLSHAIWRTEFGSDPQLVGRQVLIAGRSHDVVGIAPPEFRGLDTAPVDAWLALVPVPDLCSLTGRNDLLSTSGGGLITVARLRQDVGAEQAEQEVRQLALHRLRGDRGAAPVRELVPIADARRSRTARDRELAGWMAAGAGFVLLMACANVAGMLSVRAIERRAELSLRLQLGASRGRVFSQVMAEHLLLAVAAGAAAWGIAGWTGALLRGFFPVLVHDPWRDPRMAAVVAGLVAAAALIAGVLPAVQMARSRPDLRRSGRTIGESRSRVRRALIAAQVGCAVVLALGAVLFARSVAAAKSNLGYDLDRVVVATADLARAGIRRQVDQRALFEAMLANVRRVPGVVSAALSTASPLGSGTFSVALPVARGDAPPGATRLPRTLSFVSPEYFAAMGTRIVEGRSFLESDGPAAGRVAIVDAALARELWGRERVVGTCRVLAHPECVHIVGISEPRRIGSLRQAGGEVFHSLTQSPASVPQAVIVRVEGDADRLVGPIAAALRTTAATLPYVNVRPLEQLADVQARSWRLGSLLFGLFAALAIALASLGIYATLAFSIRQRIPEIGVRMTLGANRAGIARLVLRDGLTMIGLGWVAGVAGAVIFALLIERLLYGVAAFDPVSFTTASLLVAAAGVAGALLPALRAARIDPARALRTD